MRTVRLARVALQAELLLLRRYLTAASRRVAFGVMAAVFAIAVLVLLHAMAIAALEQFAGLSPLVSEAIVFAVDLVFLALFGLLATRSIPDPVAVEARRVRDLSLEQARQSLTLAAMVAPATRMVAQTGLVRVMFNLFTSVFRRSRR